jgi:two-component system, LuxR family, sensor kinase FixL
MRLLLKRRRLELNPFDLDELLGDTITLTRPDARVREVNLVLEIPAKLPKVRGDRVHVQQVLLNLILNGMDAMSDIAIAERQLTVHAETAADGNVEITVSDCGTGILHHNADRLFEPFFTTKSNGMGMGLAISQTIIEAHGGKIWGRNNAARGAVFKFTLPQTAEDA